VPIPQTLIDSIAGVKGFDKEAFIAVHEHGEQVTSVRFNPMKAPVPAGLPLAEKVPWASHGYYLTERPAFIFDPLIHAGVYYVQEASSMFLEQVLTQCIDCAQPLRVLDGCAAPGGKTTLLQSLISSDSLLVSNEVIKSRAAILEENCIKWGASNIIVTNTDPAALGRLEHFFDVIVVDAPCSGSGLFRREPEAIQEWSEQTVQLCHQRQQRILADVAPALKPGGLLIYSTCSYSREEDEDIADWLMETFALESLPVSIEPGWGIVEVQSERHKAFGYRFFPDKIKGEGFFISCFRRQPGNVATVKPPKRSLLQKLSKNDTAIVQPWLQAHNTVQLWKQNDMLFAFPAVLEKELLTIVDNLYVKQAGTVLGKIAGKDLVPDHALALSTLVNKETVGVSLKKDEAIQYLRKEEVTIPAVPKGWTLVQYEGQNLGWIKVLPNRVNNYYPANWRILKTYI
jgi:tRNA and rRNA cytosine-C5-methylases